jgi:hypothetical protein
MGMGSAAKANDAEAISNARTLIVTIVFMVCSLLI